MKLNYLERKHLLHLLLRLILSKLLNLILDPILLSKCFPATLFLQIYKLMLPRASLAHHRTLVRITTTIMVEINFSTQVVVMAEISSMVVVEVATTKLATPICSVRFSINMDMKLISITTDMMMIMFPLNLWITPNKSQSQSSPNPNQYPNQNPNSYLN